MYSCDTEADARMLLTMTCPQVEGGWIAEELAREQTLENLDKFSRRLQLADQFRKAKGKKKEQIKQEFFAAQMEAKGLTRLPA